MRYGAWFGLLLLGSLTAGAPERPSRFPDPIHGVTVSTHWDGLDWARSESMVPTLVDIRTTGAGWVAIHPYAGIRADGSVRFRPIDPENPPPHIVGPIRDAHAQGLKILIKPHLAYWGSPFSWRGEIEFTDAKHWERFWRDYGEWIGLLAEVTRDADGFVVGTELDRTLGHDRAWRRVIENVRSRTSVPLTYAANWSDYQRVEFWDALDAIGVQAYFPLTEEPAPDRSALEAGWSRRMGELREFAGHVGRRVLFTELGYDRSSRAAATPWIARSDGESFAEFQETCMHIALQAIRREPVVIGAFLWKWFPEPYPVGRDFQLATPGMRRVLLEAWGQGERPD